MYVKRKILTILSLNLLLGGVHGFAQYSHFPITHLDWELIDFNNPSTSRDSSAEEMDASSLPATEDMPQVTLDSYSPFSNHSSWDSNILPLTLGLSSKDSDESYSGDSALPSHNQHFSTIVSDDPVFSLSAEILRFLEALLVLDNNATDVSSLHYSSLSAHRTTHSYYLQPLHLSGSSVVTDLISRLTLPLPNRTPSPRHGLDRKKFYISSQSDQHLNAQQSTVGAVDNVSNGIEPKINPPLDVFRLNGPIALATLRKGVQSLSFSSSERDVGNFRLSSIKQRRAFIGDPGNNWTGQAFTWEMNSFEVNGTGDAANEVNYTFSPLNNNNLDGLSTSTPMDVNITATGGVGNLSVFAYGHVGGGNWQDYTGTAGWLLFTGQGGTGDGDVTNQFNLNTSGIDAWINPVDHNDFEWSIYKSSDNYYLNYAFTGDLSLSQAPEPSTYVMTGALLCFIGLNGRSRKASQQLVIAILKKLKFRQSEKNLSQINLVS